MLGSVKILEQAIRDSIIIPPQLQRNMIFRTTGLGGVFVEYYSDSRGGIYSLNSTSIIKYMFNTTDGCGRYIGDDVGIECTEYRNIKPMRGIKKKKHYMNVVQKLNIWIQANTDYLVSLIQY